MEKVPLFVHFTSFSVGPILGFYWLWCLFASKYIFAKYWHWYIKMTHITSGVRLDKGEWKMYPYWPISEGFMWALFRAFMGVGVVFRWNPHSRKILPSYKTWDRRLSFKREPIGALISWKSCTEAKIANVASEHAQLAHFETFLLAIFFYHRCS